MIRTVIDTIKAYSLLARLELLALWGLITSKTSQSNNSFLLAAPFLPPFDNGGVYRPVSWLEYSKQNKWRATALTRPPQGEASTAGKYLMKHLPGDIKILHVNFLPLRPAWNLFPRTDGSFLGAIGATLKCYKALKDNPPAVIVATGPSFDLFITAFYLSKIFGAKLVLDYRDEWTLNPMININSRHTDNYWEKRCLKNADKVIFTSQTMLESHQRHFLGLLNNKACVLHNGWEPEDQALGEEDYMVNYDNRKRVLMFAGTLGHITLPGQFLEDIKKTFESKASYCEDLEIHIIGTQVQEAIAQLNAFPFKGNLRVEGNFPKDIANRMIRDSDILLIMTTEKVSNRIPLKLFEYMASDKPIIIHGVKGEISKIVTDLEAGYFVEENDPDALGQALQEIASSPPTRWQNDKRRRWVEAHTRENLAKEFFDILENL